ncbi:MAG: LamG domain-containing protein [Bacillota bacterium]
MANQFVIPPLPVLDRKNPLTRGLVGCWSFFEGGGTTVRDISGNGNTGTLLPAGSGPTWTTGKFGNALSFDGTDDYVEFSDNSATDFGATDSFTFLLWVKTNQTPSWEARFITFRVGGSQPLIDIGVNSNGTFGLQRARSSSGSGDEVGLATTNSYNNGQWHHFAVVRDVSADKFRLYVDANLDGEKIDSTTGHFDTATKRLGYYYDGQYYNGLIDGVQIYNRALTSAEIRALYANPNIIYRPNRILFESERYLPVSGSFSGIIDAVPPVLSNLVVSSGANNGELNISFDYNEETTTVPHCEIAIARIGTDLPSGAHTGTETDTLVYNIFKPVYKTIDAELLAMVNNASGTYSVTLKLPDSGKVYVTVSARDSLGNWSNWMTPVSGYVKGDAVTSVEHSYVF